MKSLQSINLSGNNISEIEEEAHLRALADIKIVVIFRVNTKELNWKWSS